MNNLIFMKLTEFKQKKYWVGFVDLQKLKKEFTENEKKKKRYFVLKKDMKTKWKAEYLWKNIIW